MPIDGYDIAMFNDALSEEIDSRFTTSICCCDNCYEEFSNFWPDVTFRQTEFNEMSFETLWLVDNSRLPDIYSPSEISTLRRLVKCPRCLTDSPDNLWLYEHGFSDVAALERDISELLTIGNVTPFLLLEHPFAQRVLNRIRELKIEGGEQKIDSLLYRARTVESVSKRDQAPTDILTYAAAPAPYVAEGRFNHAGVPMLYLASSLETAAAEIGAPGELCCVGKIQLNISVSILDLVEIDEDDPNHDLMRALARSALLAAPRTGEGWVKRQYIFSRFVADCARSAGFEAIRYGSTKIPTGTNYVLIQPPENLASIASIAGSEIVAAIAPAARY